MQRTRDRSRIMVDCDCEIGHPSDCLEYDRILSGSKGIWAPRKRAVVRNQYRRD